jgi:hypothetical protein
LDALEPALDGASDFQLFLPWTCLTRRPFFRLGDGDARVCNSLRYEFSHLNLYLMPCMVSGTWDFSHNLLF